MMVQTEKANSTVCKIQLERRQRKSSGISTRLPERPKFCTNTAKELERLCDSGSDCPVVKNRGYSLGNSGSWRTSTPGISRPLYSGSSPLL